MSRETYPDAAQEEAQADEVEKDWPTFRHDEKLGRVAAFIWQDKAEPHLHTPGVSREQLAADGAAWRRKYDEEAQHRMARFQKHVHKKGPDGQRTPLASCKTAAKDGRCRHEFPMDLRLTEEALVVCPGIVWHPLWSK